VVKTSSDGLLVEFTSVVDALRYATEVQAAMAERNGAAPADSRIEFRVGIHQGDIVVEGRRHLLATASISARGSKDWRRRPGFVSGRACKDAAEPKPKHQVTTLIKRSFNSR
jgi:hypothetical protein